MKKVLVWESKHDDAKFDASTPELEAEAFLKMFKLMDEQGDYECCPPEGEQVDLYDKAKAGDAKAAKKFLTLRRDYEYEGWHLDEVR